MISYDIMILYELEQNVVNRAYKLVVKLSIGDIISTIFAAVEVLASLSMFRKYKTNGNYTFVIKCKIVV